MTKIVIVSVNNSFTEGMSYSELRKCAAGNWPTTLSEAADTTKMLVSFEGEVIGGFEVFDTASSLETYMLSNGRERPRTAFLLGDPIPVTKDLLELSKTERTWDSEDERYKLRRGIAFADVRTLNEHLSARLNNNGFEQIHSEGDDTYYQYGLLDGDVMIVKITKHEIHCGKVTAIDLDDAIKDVTFSEFETFNIKYIKGSWIADYRDKQIELLELYREIF